MVYATKDEDEDLKMTPGFGDLAVMTSVVEYGHEQDLPYILTMSIK